MTQAVLREQMSSHLGGRPAIDVDCLLSLPFLDLIGLMSRLSTAFLSGLK